MSKPKNDNNNTFDKLIGDNIRKKIEGIYKKMDTEDEFELMFSTYNSNNNGLNKYRMGSEQFLKVLGYLTHVGKARKLKLENYTTLDINYSKKDTLESNRITINGIDSINKYMEMLHLRKNHVIFSVLAGLVEKDESLSILRKIRNNDNIVDIEDFDMRIRMCQEKKISKGDMKELESLDETTRENIIFRYKQRVSLFIEDSKNVVTRIDLTNTKMSKNINRLEEMSPIYELEIDLMTHEKGPAMKYLETIYNEATVLLKVMQQSNYIMTNSLEKEILNVYSDLLGVNKETMTSLEGRKAQSLEVQHVVDKLPDKYAVTDKADGDRYFLIIHDNKVYLISDNLNVKNTGLVLPKDKTKYNNTILDGEYLFLTKSNRHVFLAFDCLYTGSTDVREVATFTDRLKVVDEVIENCFVMPGQKGFKIKEYTGEFNTDKILKFHDGQIKEYMNALNNDINNDKEKQYPLIRRKYFITVNGGQHNEIFKYSELMWNKYVTDDQVGCPYTLDGLIYHPLDQKYIVSIKESKFVEYKWKPPEKNSIDFYITFERSTDTGKILTLYDNSRDEFIKGKAYRIVHLYVGRMSYTKSKTGKMIEQPTLFQRETNKYVCHLFVDDGGIRDQEGNIIQDMTVVEFYYNNDPNIPEEHRWVPIRTRHDKTEMVRRYRKRYGNYYDIANRIWRSISNPVLMDDFNILAKDDMYDKHIDIMRRKIDHSVIMSEAQENVYFQIRTNLAKPMRNFHNWIKSIVIYTHCNPTYEEDKNMSVLDIACGRGSDIMKFYYSKVDFYVGVDIDNNGLISPVDGAISRYNRLRKTHPNFPRMSFIHADAGIILDYDEQSKAIGTMTTVNKNLMLKFFSKDAKKRTQFDRVDCQFAIHYFLGNDITWNNFLQNLNMYTKPGGYFLVSCFDADRVMELLKDKDQFTSYYTNTNGEQKVMFEIVKKYSDKNMKQVGVGYAIDVHNALISQEGVYNTEYLVQKAFLRKELLDKCDMELVETDLLDNQFHIHKDYFSKYIKYEENEKTRQFLINSSAYYDQKNSVNKSCYQMTRLNRYYVFRKKDVKSAKTGTKNQKGGYKKSNYTDYVLDDASDIFDPVHFVRRDIHEAGTYSFMRSVHDILQTGGTIPKSVTSNNFYKDVGCKMIRDNNVNTNNINKLNDSLVVGHEYSYTENEDVALDGLNFIVAEKDCDDDDGSCNLTYYKKKKTYTKAPTVILFKEEGKYYPIYRYDNKGKLIGMFNTRSKFVKELLTTN
jgi:SAM-dependent methyltransferase